MASSLADFLAQYTAAHEAYPATAFRPLICPCGSENFLLARAGSITQRTCTRCAKVCYIDRFGDGAGWAEVSAAEEWYHCPACGGDRANICLGFAGYPD